MSRSFRHAKNELQYGLGAKSTLLATLNILTGEVSGQNMQRRPRHFSDRYLGFDPSAAYPGDILNVFALGYLTTSAPLTGGTIKRTKHLLAEGTIDLASI